MGSTKITGLAACLTFGVLASLPASPVLAQAQQSRLQIDEVVVTAQRRAESMQTVAIAVSAFSEEELASRRIDGLGSLASRTPGFAIGEFMPSQPQVYIRGIGSNDDGPGADPSTAVFLDEVYVGRAAGWTANLFDLERVEVLRGPQGTLYGKNVVGGAVNMISRKPDEEFRARISGSVGSYDLREFQGLLNFPLADNLFGKIAYSSRSRDGYLKSLVGDFPEFFPLQDPVQLGRFNQLDRGTESLRANLRWLASENLEINVSVDNAKLDENAPGFHRVGANAADVQAFSGLIENYQNRPRVNLQERSGRTTNETTGFMARVDYELGWATLTSISAYRESETLNTDCCHLNNEREAALLASSPSAPAGGNVLLAPAGNVQDESADQFSQELRLTSTGTGALEWVAGLYYLREEARRIETFDYGLGRFDGAGGVNVIVPPSLGKSDQDARTESIAAYGQATWSVTDRMRLTAGARWTKDDKRQATSVQAGGLLFRETFEVNQSDSWSELTPRFVIDYQASEDVFVYALASKGFKSGGFQGQPPAEINATLPFLPETAWLYEAGIKSDWFDRRARVNLAVFYTDYSDLQVLQLLTPVETPGVSVLVAQNAADARVQGVELELTVLPLPGLTVTASYAYLDATFKEFFAPSGFTLPTDVDINQRKGNSLRNAPKHTASIMAQYEQVLDAGMRLVYQLDWRYQDESFQEPDNQPVSALPSYSLLDGRISLLNATGDWELSLWAENLLNKDHFIHGFPSQNGGTMTPGAPRMFGATLSWTM
ncbi:MAG: TonB-dependent receptor [Gammaproteobacteria bacterium]|nr:TonB-dependent receptor [Gammaproteobacteria bacterium]